MLTAVLRPVAPTSSRSRSFLCELPVQTCLLRTDVDQNILRLPAFVHVLPEPEPSFGSVPGHWRREPWRSSERPPPFRFFLSAGACRPESRPSCCPPDLYSVLTPAREWRLPAHEKPADEHTRGAHPRDRAQALCIHGIWSEPVQFRQVPRCFEQTAAKCHSPQRTSNHPAFQKIAMAPPLQCWPAPEASAVPEAPPEPAGRSAPVSSGTGFRRPKADLAGPNHLPHLQEQAPQAFPCPRREAMPTEDLQTRPRRHSPTGFRKGV